jgi:3-phenylpropionate/cinnamic acid dioxygenase small subunit
MSDLQQVIDFHQVSQTLYRYASCVDKKDFTTLRTLLTDDAMGKYGERSLSGADAIVHWIEDSTRDRTWQHHLLSVYHVDVTGDEATALTYHTSHQTTVADPDTVKVIVARYHDDLRKVDGVWKIANKVMEIGWREERHAPQVRQADAAVTRG